MSEPPAEPVEQPTRPLIQISPDMLRDTPDLYQHAQAQIAGMRPDCSCQPILAYPDGPVVGYHDLCPEHSCGCSAHARVEGTGQRIGRRDGHWEVCP